MARPLTRSRRAQLMDEFAAHEVAVSDGFAFRTDEALERAHQGWVAMGKPRRAAVGLDNEPGVGEKVVITVRKDGEPAVPTAPKKPEVFTW